MKIIYGDLLFLVNFSMDYIGLLITSRLLGRRPHAVRLPIAAAIGAMFGVASCFMTGRLYIYSLGLAVCILMCFCAFGAGARQVLTSSVIYVCVSALLGGLMTALYSIVGGSFMSSASSTGTALFAIVSAAVFALSSLFTRLLRRNASGDSREICVFCRNKSVKLTVLIDSGNFLCDSSGRAAIIVSIEKIKAILPESVVRLSADDALSIDRLDLKEAGRVSFLFASTPTGRQMLIGYKPDRIEYSGQGIDCIIALDASGCDYGEYDGIMSNKISV